MKMSWPIVFVIVSVAAFLAAVIGALLLQFSRNPPQGLAVGVWLSFLVGLASISVYVV
jgi:zinc transporter ZupT